MLSSYHDVLVCVSFTLIHELLIVSTKHHVELKVGSQSSYVTAFVLAESCSYPHNAVKYLVYNKYPLLLE